MHSQGQVAIPWDIISLIISYCNTIEIVSFRRTCKKVCKWVDVNIHPLCAVTIAHCKAAHIALDTKHNILYASYPERNCIYKIDLSSKKTSLLCGNSWVRGCKDGNGSSALFSHPQGVAIDQESNILYIADCWNCVIRRLHLSTGVVDTPFGTTRIRKLCDGMNNDATFCEPRGLALDSINKHLYVSDTEGNAIRRIYLKEGRVETIHCRYEARLCRPSAIAWNPITQELYVGDICNHVIRVISPENGTMRTLWSRNSEIKFHFVRGLSMDTISNCLYVTDSAPVLRKVYLSAKMPIMTDVCGVHHLWGSGDGPNPLFHTLAGVAVDTTSHCVYITDETLDKVIKIENRKQKHIPSLD